MWKFWRPLNPQKRLKLIGINYAPDFRVRYGVDGRRAQFIDKIFEAHDQAQQEFIAELLPLKTYFDRIPVEAKDEDPGPRWVQPWFPPLDGMAIYGLAARNRPKRIVEIGSGNSTQFIRQAIHDLAIDCTLTSIDPHPRVEVDALADHSVRCRLEDADLSIFSELEEGDMVFFDGSHRSFQNSDVTVFFVEVLPSLASGVNVGLHDICWPDDYPENWVERYYNEQYLLAAYMLALGTDFPLILSCAYAGRRYPHLIMKCLDREIVSELRERNVVLGGGAIWFRKPAVEF